MRQLALLTALAAVPVSLAAQAATVTTAVKAARMLDLASGQMVANPVIVIQGNRIVSLGQATVPKDARVVDLGDVTLLPGFIDLHTHLSSEISAASFTAPVTLTMADLAFSAANNARKTALAGFTTVRDFGGDVTAKQLSFEELKAIVDEATRHGIRVAAHAHGTEGIKAAVRAGVTTIEHGSMLDDEAIAMMKERGTYLVPTTYLADRINLAVLPPLVRSKAETIIPFARASLKKAIAAGVRIGFGTDAGVYPHGENAGEFIAYTRLGMSPLDALRSATIVAAEALGVTDRGTIAPGKLADLIAVPGNPLQDMTATQRVTWVMVGGKIVTP